MRLFSVWCPTRSCYVHLARYVLGAMPPTCLLQTLQQPATWNAFVAATTEGTLLCSTMLVVACRTPLCQQLAMRSSVSETILDALQPLLEAGFPPDKIQSGSYQF